MYGNSTQLVAGTHLTCLVEQSVEDEYTEWKLLGDAAMGITEVCQCDPGFQLLMMRNELVVCGSVLYVRQMFCMSTSGAWYKCGKYIYIPKLIQIGNTFSNSSC